MPQCFEEKLKDFGMELGNLVAAGYRVSTLVLPIRMGKRWGPFRKNIGKKTHSQYAKPMRFPFRGAVGFKIVRC